MSLYLLIIKSAAKNKKSQEKNNYKRLTVCSLNYYFCHITLLACEMNILSFLAVISCEGKIFIFNANK